MKDVISVTANSTNQTEKMTKYETKDSGRRQEYASGMRRDVADDKPDLIQWMPMSIPYKETLWYRMGMAAQRGAQKYGRRNWELAGEDPKSAAEELERFRSSAHRHMMQWLHGETDEDHASATVFNLICAEMVKYKIDRRQMMEDMFEFQTAQELREEETPWTEEEHEDRVLYLYADSSPLLLNILVELPGAEELTPLRESLAVENHPDYAWVWEDEDYDIEAPY